MPTETNDERSGERIAKLLARAGIASRREIERMIAEGRVAIDGVTLDTPATVLRSLAGVTVDGKPVAAPPPARLFLYHKPAGLLVTERDPAGRPTIYDRLPSDLPRLVPVGRLDLATEGLLLLTTDGGFKRQLELPATGVERTYRARAYGDITQARLEALIDGIEIDGVRYGPIDANMERRTGANGWIEMTLTEGKNREVRRVLEYLGLQVSRLIRTRYGPFVLGELLPGEVGEARQVDLVGFRRAIEAKRPKTEERVAVAPRVVAPPEPAAPPARTNEPDRALRKRTAPDRGGAADRSPSKATKPSSGWGSRARPSRPAEPRSPRFDEDDPRPSTRRPRESGDPSPTAGSRAARSGRAATPDQNTNARSPRPREMAPRVRGGDGMGESGRLSHRRPREGGDPSSTARARAARSGGPATPDQNTDARSPRSPEGNPRARRDHGMGESGRLSHRRPREGGDPSSTARARAARSGGPATPDKNTDARSPRSRQLNPRGGDGGGERRPASSRAPREDGRAATPRDGTRPTAPRGGPRPTTPRPGKPPRKPR